MLILVVRLRGLEQGAEVIGSAEEAEHKEHKQRVAVATTKSEAMFAQIDSDHSNGIDRRSVFICWSVRIALRRVLV